jgi:hypothetical protein
VTAEEEVADDEPATKDVLIEDDKGNCFYFDCSSHFLWKIYYFV